MVYVLLYINAWRNEALRTARVRFRDGVRLFYETSLTRKFSIRNMFDSGHQRWLLRLKSCGLFLETFYSLSKSSPLLGMKIKRVGSFRVFKKHFFFYSYNTDVKRILNFLIDLFLEIRCHYQTLHLIFRLCLTNVHKFDGF